MDSLFLPLAGSWCCDVYCNNHIGMYVVVMRIMTLLSIVVLRHVGTLLSSRCTVPVARLTFNS